MEYYRATTDMIDEAKRLTGAPPESGALIELLLSFAGQTVLNLIRQPVMPAALDHVVVQMAADSYILHQNAQNPDDAQIVSSVSDQGQSVTFRTSDFARGLQETAEKVVKNYDRQLERYRKPGW